MNRRTALILATVLVCVGGIVSLARLLIGSLGPSAQAFADAEVVLQLSPIIPGEIQAFHVHGRPLFILRPNREQQENLARLDAHVADRHSAAYVPELDAFVYWGISTNRGCDLQHKPPQVSMLLEYNPAAEWLGGFWSGVCELSYDYAGRTISSHEFTFSGYRAPSPNLSKPKLRVSGDVIAVQML
jgi:hypothetical protein